MAIDWSKSMQQEFEYYIVDPKTWLRTEKLNTVLSASIRRDLNVDTLGSASFDLVGDIGEKYIRTFLIARQNGQEETICLGTHLVQSPKEAFNGFFTKRSCDGFTPLIELTENKPQVGYSLKKGNSPMRKVNEVVSANCRAPLIPVTKDSDILSYDFVANGDETWLDFATSLANVSNKKISLLNDCSITFRDPIDITTKNPVWTYSESNNSIWYPDVEIDKDMYSIPNVVEVVYSSDKRTYHEKVYNNNPISPISVVNRGREITHRVTEVFLADVNQAAARAYANDLLKDISKLKVNITYSHGYCPVTIGDCVLIDYPSIGVTNTKAIVLSQNISCETGCKISETAQFEIDLLS